MASFTPISGKLSFRLDSGVVKEGKVVYKTISLSNIDPSSPAGDVAAVAEATIGLIALTCDRVSLTRVDVVEL